jgi:hypothetical protein
MEIAINAVMALAISIVTALIAVQISLRKFYAERWWDRKVEAYTNIFEALYKLKNYSDLKYEDYLGERTLSEDDAKRLGEQCRVATDEVDKAIEIGSFTISHESIECLSRFRKRPRLSFHENPTFELAEEESEFLTECIGELKGLAAKDLKRKLKRSEQDAGGKGD